MARKVTLETQKETPRTKLTTMKQLATILEKLGFGEETKILEPLEKDKITVDISNPSLQSLEKTVGDAAKISILSDVLHEMGITHQASNRRVSVPLAEERHGEETMIKKNYLVIEYNSDTAGKISSLTSRIVNSGNGKPDFVGELYKKMAAEGARLSAEGGWQENIDFASSVENFAGQLQKVSPAQQARAMRTFQRAIEESRSAGNHR